MDYKIRIRNLREDSDKTQQEIADYLGTSQTMYARYERGANEMPLRHLIRLAQYYNVDMNYLCGYPILKIPTRKSKTLNGKKVSSTLYNLCPSGEGISYKVKKQPLLPYGCKSCSLSFFLKLTQELLP